MSTTKDIGDEAEELAVHHLLTQGYTILERNWRHHHLELDIIAQQKNVIVVIEVKSRAGNYLVEPALAVNRNKQKMIISAANAYLIKKNLDLEVRFDIISIVFFRGSNELEHIESAFYPLVR